MGKIEGVEKLYEREDLPDFDVGDTIRVYYRVVEGGRTRNQMFQGVVIRKQGKGGTRTFTIRKISFGVGVEKTFPFNSPNISQVKIVSKGKVRRAKLYYLREKTGKQARIKEKR